MMHLAASRRAALAPAQEGSSICAAALAAGAALVEAIATTLAV
jgi:hypothetical protein